MSQDAWKNDAGVGFLGLQEWDASTACTQKHCQTRIVGYLHLGYQRVGILDVRRVARDFLTILMQYKHGRASTVIIVRIFT